MTKTEAPTLDVRQAKEMARYIIAHHFGTKPRRIIYQPGGLTNFVFQAHHPEGSFIVRISPDPANLQVFIKEQWAVAKAREVGVPTVEILEVGNQVVPLPYMVSQMASGQEATWHPQRQQILREMGRCAALVNSIPTSGFGSTFDWSSNQLSRNETWSDYLQQELQPEARLQILEKYKMLLPKDLKKIRSIFREMAKWTPKSSLNHSDIRLKNTIVSQEGGIIAIIDWENCISQVSPHWELSLALHDLSIDEKQEFLAGYGLSEKKVAEIAPYMKALNLVNYAPEIERLAQAKENAQLKHYRTRLSGALDLYSL